MKRLLFFVFAWGCSPEVEPKPELNMEQLQHLSKALNGDLANSPLLDQCVQNYGSSCASRLIMRHGLRDPQFRALRAIPTVMPPIRSGCGGKYPPRHPRPHRNHADTFVGPHSPTSGKFVE